MCFSIEEYYTNYMKKLDKLILKSFLGPFFLTFIVVVFILLMQYMLKYFDELVGKGLSASVYAELLFFFSINMTTLALPLAVLLSSLMTFGNLGEHFELTAVKSSGISLTRALVPLMVFSFFLTVLAFINNDQVVPKANLKAYSLLWDIRQTKPSLSLQEGSFYNGIPNYSIKVNKKFPDEVSLKDLIIYDHTKGQGNTDVILADSGRMYTKYNDQYLFLEMFDGEMYSETTSPDKPAGKKNEPANFVRNKFKKNVMIMSLESFKMSSTREEYFTGSQVVKNIGQLSVEIDSMKDKITEKRYNIFQNATAYNTYADYSKIQVPEKIAARYQEIDSLKRVKEEEARRKADSTGTTPGGGPEPAYFGTNAERREMLKTSGNTRAVANTPGTNRSDSIALAGSKVPVDTAALARVEEKYKDKAKLADAYKTAVGQARYMKNSYEIQASGLNDIQKSLYKWQIEVHKKWANAVACMVMFMIGAPLGSIIKRGGLGIPVIISIAFFIIFYVFTMFGEKWAREGIVSPAVGIWSANLILLPFGFIFLWQARNDARLFESDFYSVMIARFRSSLGERVRRPQLLRKKPS